MQSTVLYGCYEQSYLRSNQNQCIYQKEVFGIMSDLMIIFRYIFLFVYEHLEKMF